MQLFFDTKSIRNLRNIIDNIPAETNRAYASIAYSSSSLLIDKIIEMKIELEWFGLFNKDEATTLQLLEKAMKNKQYIRFYPILDNFHPKVIYFEDYGMYLGSANMTEKALYHNIEAGIFLTDAEINKNQEYLKQIKGYFEELKTLSTPFTEEDLERYKGFLQDQKDVKESNKINIIENELEKNFQEHFSNYIKPEKGSTMFGKKTKKSQDDRRKKEFIQEWKGTQHELTIIMGKIKEDDIFPVWVPKTDAIGIIADQFLHAYYYSRILKESDERNSLKLVEKMFYRNNNKKEEALNNALEWWKNLKQAPSGEEKHINEWSAKNRGYLSKDKVLTLSEAELIDLLKHIHAARVHARQMKKEELGLPMKQITEDECVEAYGSWLFNQRSEGDISVLENLYYLLYEKDEPLEERLFKLLYDKKYKIPHFGKSIMGEIIGWAMPDKYPIRNNRVNKSLRALGYDVLVE